MAVGEVYSEVYTPPSARGNEPGMKCKACAKIPGSCRAIDERATFALMSEATTVESEVDDILPAGSIERAEAKERIKLAYITGRATLLALAVKERVPYTTAMRWSKEEQWHVAAEETRTLSASKTVESLSDFIAEQRTLQVKRALTRAQKLQDLADLAADNEKSKPDGLLASAVQALASAEERADNIVRRNLGMDQQSGGNSSVSINILAGGISLS